MDASGGPLASTNDPIVHCYGGENMIPRRLPGSTRHRLQVRVALRFDARRLGDYDLYSGRLDDPTRPVPRPVLRFYPYSCTFISLRTYVR